MKVTLDTPLGDILNDPKAKVVLDKYLPGASANPMVQMAKGMTIKMILAMPQAAQLGLTKEKAEAMLAEINKVL
jgi:hypothetical protein